MAKSKCLLFRVTVKENTATFFFKVPVQAVTILMKKWVRVNRRQCKTCDTV